MNDSEMAGVAVIGAIFKKSIFRGTTSKKRKSGIGIGQMVIVEEPSVASTKSEAEGLERVGGIEGNSISGSD